MVLRTLYRTLKQGGSNPNLVILPNQTHKSHTMKMQSQTYRALAAGLCLAASLLPTPAADKTWDGGGDQVSWNASPANWVGDVAPVANDSLFFAGGAGLSPNNDFAANTVFNGITFNSGAGAFTLNGAEINLGAGAGITNNSSADQAFSLNVNGVGSGRWYNAATGKLLFTGVLKQAINKVGGQTMRMQGSTGNSSVSLNAFEGTIELANSAGNSANSSVYISTNGTVRIVGAGTFTDQIHFNQRLVMNGGKFQMQHVDSVNTTRLEEIAALSGTNLDSVVECGLAAATNRLDIGGGNNHRGIYSGTIRDGAAGQMAFRVYRANNYEQLNGTNTYSGVTLVDNTQNAGAARLIVNGAHIGGGDYTVNGHNTDGTRLAYLHGSGIISASVINLNLNSLLSPGGSLSVDLSDAATFADSTAILTISNAVNLNTASSSFEVQISGTTPGSAHDQLAIAGSGSFSNNNANLKLVLGYTPQSGDKFTIVSVPGTDPTRNVGVFASLNGVATDLSQGATFIEPSSGQNMQISYRAEGTTFDMGAGNGNDIMLRVVSSPGTNLTWRGDVNNLWDVTTTANWRNAGGTAITFTNGDNVTFNDTGSNSAPVDLVGDLSPGNIVVNATNNYIFATSGTGKLTGTVVLTKTNTGTLTILTDNLNAGSTLVRQGTLRVGTNGTSGLLGGALDIRTNASVVFDRSDTYTNSGTITGGGMLINNSTNGTLILTANNTFTGPVVANAGTLQFGDGSGVTGGVAGRVTNNATVAYVYNNQTVINNSLSGTGRVNLINTTTAGRKFIFGAGPSTVTNTAFSGFIDVGPYVCLNTPDLSNGTNHLGIGSTVYVEDTGSVYLDRAGYYLTTFYLQGAGNGAGSAGTPVTLEIEGSASPTITTIAGDVNVLSSATIGGFIGTSRISGRLVDTNGASTMTFANGRGPGSGINLQLGSLSGPNHWADTIIDPDLSGGAFTVTAMTPSAISTNGLTLGAHGNFALNGNNHTVAKLQSTAPGGTILNNHASVTAVLTVGADDSSTGFDGVFGNGAAAPLGVAKVGAGTLTLSGSSSNTGPVTVNGGTILLIGEGSFSNATEITIGSGAVLDVTARTDGSLNLNSGQTLKGNGDLNGGLVALAGSTINPGASIGTLTVTNATLNGNLLMEVNRGASPNCDQFVVTGTRVIGGSLTVTNIGAALQANDTFQLFPTGVTGFTFVPQTYDIANAKMYTWQNDLSTLGSVKVLTVSAIPQPTLGTALTGNTLTFSWTGPFKLQAQTNSLSVGVSSNWSAYPGGGTSPVSVMIDPTKPTVFYRLSLQ